MRSLFIKKLWLSILLSLSIFIFPLASTKSQTPSQQKPDKLQRFSPDEMRESEELKARGVIVKFHRWPNSKEQKEIIRKLKAASLKKTKSIRSFQTWLFEWSEGGLKLSRLGKEACKTLKGLSSVKRCNPDHLLPLNRQHNIILSDELQIYRVFNQPSFILAEASQKTEAGFVEHCTLCDKQSSISPVPLNIRICNLISHEQKLMKGKLSDYWAQELIGSDLLREELKKEAPPEIENWIAVFDTRRGGHRIGVQNLISDEGLHAVLPELGGGDLSFLHVGIGSQNVQGWNDYKKGRGYKPALSLYETGYPGDYLFGFKERAPNYINNSMSWKESPDIYEAFEKLSSSGVSRSIVVISSGNDFPKRLDNMESKASKNFDAILVGSFAPGGFVSHFSQSGREVAILAPSDDWITSAREEGKYYRFGGTSGAAPLVTGSLAAFEWLSGYHPTAEEAKILLEKAALPTLHSFEKPRINGAGLLNAYKMGEVAKRLEEKCRNKSVSCFKEEILKDENYHFAEDESLKGDLRRVFPNCVRGGNPNHSLKVSSCKEKGEALKRLRKAALLNPDKEKLKSLSCIYRAAGFLKNSEALEKLSLALGTEAEVRAELRAIVRKEEPVSVDSLRLMLGMGGFEEEFKLSDNLIAVRIAPGVGETAVPTLIKALESEDPVIRTIITNEEIVRRAGKMGETAIPVLEKAFEIGDLRLQRTAVMEAGHIKKPSSLPLVEKAFAADNIDLRMDAVLAAGLIGEPGFPLIRKAFDSGNSGLQYSAITAARWAGKSGLSLLKQMVKKKDLNPKRKRYIEKEIILLNEVYNIKDNNS